MKYNRKSASLSSKLRIGGILAFAVFGSAPGAVAQTVTLGRATAPPNAAIAVHMERVLRPRKLSISISTRPTNSLA
jgi:hypothetical protein